MIPRLKDESYKPVVENHEIYMRLYSSIRNCTTILAEENDVMKRLKAVKENSRCWKTSRSGYTR